jgi:hypothetical protein
MNWDVRFTYLGGPSTTEASRGLRDMEGRRWATRYVVRHLPKQVLEAGLEDLLDCRRIALCNAMTLSRSYRERPG